MDLVGLGEIAELAGVKRNTVDQWRVRGILPAPDWVVSGNPVWKKQTIVRWLERREQK